MFVYIYIYYDLFMFILSHLFGSKLKIFNDASCSVVLFECINTGEVWREQMFATIKND